MYNVSGLILVLSRVKEGYHELEAWLGYIVLHYSGLQCETMSKTKVSLRYRKGEITPLFESIQYYSLESQQSWFNSNIPITVRRVKKKKKRREERVILKSSS